MPYLGHTPNYSPGCDPLGQSPLLYFFRGFLGTSLALERHHASVHTSEHVGRSPLTEDAPVDIDRLGPRNGVEVAQHWPHYPVILQPGVPVRHLLYPSSRP